MFGSVSMVRVQYPKCANGPYCQFNPNENGVHLSRSLYLNSVREGAAVHENDIKFADLGGYIFLPEATGF